jgi:geranylgeranyl reductase family protein
MKNYDVIVVGAGPIGCRTAELIAKKGYKVLILEEHSKIGKPLQCAGLVSWRLKQLVTDLPKDIIINKVNYAKFFSPSKNYLELESKKPVYVIDRQALDNFLASKAKEVGAQLKLSTRFSDFSYFQDGIEVKTTKGNFKTKLLVGADGPNSTVAKKAGLMQPENVLIGMQTNVKGYFDPYAVELWFGKEITEDFFGWVIPENESIARIGIASKKKTAYYFRRFLRRRINKIEKPSIVGTIKYGLMKDTVADRIILVGDAACQVKPFSGGGIVYGLIGSGFAALACIKALKKETYDYNFLKETYDEQWKKKLTWPIRKGLLLNKFIYSVPDWLLNLFINSAGWFKFLFEKIDMDMLTY